MLFDRVEGTKFYLRDKTLPEIEVVLLQYHIDFTQITEIHFRTISTAIFPELLRQFSRLEVISFSDSDITTIPEWIGEFCHLKSLSLNETKITTLPAAIGRLGALESLSLCSTRIRNLPPDLRKCQNLRRLFLDHLHLNELPAWIGDFPHLYLISLDSASLPKIPSTIGNLTNLKILNLHHCAISTLPTEILLCSRLSCLSLFSAKMHIPALILEELLLSPTLTKFDGEISLEAEYDNMPIVSRDSHGHPTKLDLRPFQNFSKHFNFARFPFLVEVDLSETTLSVFPASLCACTSLERINLFSTRISSIPPQIGQLTHLKELDVSNTPLRDLPPELGRCLDLTDLTLFSTFIDMIPSEVALLPHITELILDGTHVLAPIRTLLASREGRLRYAHYVEEIYDKLSHNRPLDDLDFSYPWQSIDTSALEQFCINLNTPICREFLRLLEEKQRKIPAKTHAFIL